MASTKKDIEKLPDAQALVVHEYGEDEGKGFEHQTKADTSIPFVVLLQGLSPQVADGKGKPGDFFNTVTEQVWSRDQGFLFVPATTRHVFTEWVPRDKGGGYRGQHTPDDDVVMKAVKNAARFGKYQTDEGNQLTETFYVYGVISSEDGQAESMAIIAFWSTKIRPYKGWMTRLRQTAIVDAQGRRVRPPLYAHLSRITSTTQKNNEGTFSVPVISSGDPRGIVQSLLQPNDERFLMAKACMQLVDSDQAKVDYSQTKGEGDMDGDNLVGKDGKPLF